MVYDHLPQTMKHEPARNTQVFPKMGDSKVIQMGYVLTLTHIDPHEEHGGPPRNQKDVLHIFEVIFF